MMNPTPLPPPPKGSKAIPHYANLLASEEGDVYWSNGKLATGSTFPTTKGYYLTVYAGRLGQGNRYWLSHRLVALAHCNPPENWEELQVNHKDGDKLNNHKDNLEWVTRSQNLKHSYEIGLRVDHRQYFLQDEDKEPVLYKSLQDMADVIGTTIGMIWSYVPRQAYLKRRFMNRWRITIDDKHNNSRTLINRTKQARKIVVYDVEYGVREILPTSFLASIVVGSNFATLLYLCKRNRTVAKHMANGYLVFFEEDDPVIDDSIELVEIIKSRVKHLRSCELFLDKMEKQHWESVKIK